MLAFKEKINKPINEKKINHWVILMTVFFTYLPRQESTHTHTHVQTKPLSRVPQVSLNKFNCTCKLWRHANQILLNSRHARQKFKPISDKHDTDVYCYMRSNKRRLTVCSCVMCFTHLVAPNRESHLMETSVCAPAACCVIYSGAECAGWPLTLLQVQ